MGNCGVAKFHAEALYQASEVELLLPYALKEARLRNATGAFAPHSAEVDRGYLMAKLAKSSSQETSSEHGFPLLPLRCSRVHRALRISCYLGRRLGMTIMIGRKWASRNSVTGQLIPFLTWHRMDKPVMRH